MTTRPKRSAKSSRIEALVGDDRELFKSLLKESLQEVLEGEMTEAVRRWGCSSATPPHG